MNCDEIEGEMYIMQIKKCAWASHVGLRAGLFRVLKAGGEVSCLSHYKTKKK